MHWDICVPTRLKGLKNKLNQNIFCHSHDILFRPHGVTGPECVKNTKKERREINIWLKAGFLFFIPELQVTLVHPIAKLI